MNFDNFEIFAELVLFSVNLFSRSDMHIHRVFTGALQNRFTLASGALNFILCFVQSEIVQISVAVSTAYERWDSLEIKKTRLFWGVYHREQLPTVLPYACASLRLIHIWVSLAIGSHSEVLWHQQDHINTVGETICPKTLQQYCALAHGLEAEDCGTEVEFSALPEPSFFLVWLCGCPKTDSYSGYKDGFLNAFRQTWHLPDTSWRWRVNLCIVSCLANVVEPVCSDIPISLHLQLEHL